ncbi:MAG: AraC family transcriptional regulator [Lachnospiraceae bacterium]|nr:AraC family transcriptional regulator [Lachnospiraceae bacterium]
MFFSLHSSDPLSYFKREHFYDNNIVINGPIRMTFETMHPDDPKQNFTVSILEKDACFISTVEADDPNSPVNRKELHTHECFELMFVIKGEMYQNIEYKRHVYPQGSLCLVNKKIHHAEEFSTDFRCVFLMMSAELIHSIFFPATPYIFDEETFPADSPIRNFFYHNTGALESSMREYMDFIPVSDDPRIYKAMYDRFDAIMAHLLSPHIGTTFAIQALILEIFSALMDEASYSTIPVRIGSDREFLLFDRIRSSMAKTNGRISRAQLVRELSYSGSYLNAVCKKYSGLSLFDYGMLLCMEEAARLLVNTSLTAEEISLKLGFSNRSHFYSLFRRHYGCTPSAYRKSLRDS